MINVTQSPNGLLLSAGNDNIFCVSGDTIGAPNVFEYKYICDIFVNGVLQVTLKSFPDPLYNVGVFNLKNILSSFLGTDYIPGGGNLVNQCPNSSCNVFFEFGEEFVSGSTFVINRDVNDTSTYIFINASFPSAIYADDGGISSDYFPDNNVVRFLEYKSYQDTFQFGPGLVFPQYLNQNRFLYLVNNRSGGNNNNTLQQILVTTFDANDNLVGQYTATSPYDYTSATDVQAIAVGYPFVSSFDWNYVAGPGTIFSGGNETYYIIQVFGVECSWTSARFNILDDCGRFASDAIYIDWLNELGGFSSWLFNKKNETTQTKQVQKYKKIIGSLSAGGEFSFSPLDRSQQIYYTVLQDQTVMYSDFLSDADVIYLKSLFSSPVVYSRPANGLFTAVTVEDNSYRINKRVNQKIYSLQLTINQSLNDYRQQL